ncbi:hypothetical protein DRW03_15215 [Corallococcus sp. H22C18031201]|nr:hypothetical protein DRW03_15215 [Corallococcus sp. H22C18031201]
MVSGSSSILRVMLWVLLLAGPSVQAFPGPATPPKRRPSSTLHDNSAIGELLKPVAEALVQGLVYALRDGGTHRERLDMAPLDQGLGLRHAQPLTIRTGAQALLLRDGSAVDFFLGMDLGRLGVAARWMRSSPRSRQLGSALVLTELRISWALLASEFARLRLEAGAGALLAPDKDRLGPMAGLSFEGCVWGPLDVELRAMVTPLPYRQVDGTAGLAAHVGALVVRGGARGIYLDHAGALAAHARDGGLLGLYLGMGVDF